MTKLLDFAEGVKLSIDVLMQPIFFGGMRGAGKTHGAKKLYEAGYAAGAQCISVVPVGKWWSLRLAKDGKSPGLKDVIVLGGTHGDVLLTADMGAVVAKLLVEKRIHAVIDVSLMRKGERNRFLAAFLEEFWLLKKVEDEAFPVVLFLEEAHAICPQRPQPDQARMLGACEDLVREGRNHGVGVVLLDQRSAVVNKNVIALVEVIIVMRTIHHLDRNTYREWVDEKGEENVEWVSELKHLQKGQAFLCAPGLGIFERITILPIDTFDATATAEIGGKAKRVGKISPVDVTALRESLGKVIEEAEKNDPAVLRRQIIELKKELAKRAEKVEVAVELKEMPVMSKADLNRLEKVMEKLARSTGEVNEAILAARGMGSASRGTWVAEATKNPIKYVKGDAGRVTGRATVEPRSSTESAGFKSRALPSSAQEGEPKLGSKMKVMLQILATVHPERGMSRAQLAVWVGMVNGGAFNNYLGSLRTAGFIEYPGSGQVRITQLGLDACPAGSLPTQKDVVDEWTSKQTGKGREMLQIVLEVWPKEIARDDLAQRVGMVNGGAFNNYLGSLRSAGLVEYPNRGLVRATELLQVNA